MGQKITVSLAGRVHKFNAESPEIEEDIRKAAGIISRKMEAYQKKYPMNTADIMSIVALNEGVEVLRLEKELEDMKKKEERLYRELESYLDRIDKI